jgi:Family of unknown function (DUF6519)/Right handed beta helix region
MGGDYTRFTYTPRKRYSGVFMQQGRVQLDADWNEAIEGITRRWQVQAMDTFGHCAVPKATTPDAFKIIPIAGPPPNLALGEGRMYVDGLLAEILEGELHQGNPVSYLNQPFYPLPPPLPTGGEAIVYVDVWEREVTYIEDPELLEKALGGPDTTTRTQTVWQVKVEGVDNATCGAALPAPSGGRLSSRGIAPPPADDPCIISPSGGFRGLENRLYRVEVHTEGDLTNAMFKWSRENASVVSTVQEITTNGGQSTLTVSRIGRDKILRFEINDWVEVTDDRRELMGQPGIMGRIAAPPDEAKQTITLDRALPAGTFDAADESRHTRVRRWDQRLDVNGDGLVAVANAWLPLEDGVEIRFSLDPATATFHVGDYWVFAARTADGSVEELVEATPRGIIHHYCQLATLTGLGEAPAAHDCRNLWPDCGCCCTVTVGDGISSHGGYNDIATALATAAAKTSSEEPIHICVLPGTYRLTTPVIVARNRVTITGCGRATRILPSGTAFQIIGDEVALEALSITGNISPPLIDVRGNRSRIQGNWLQNQEGLALLSTGVEDLVIADNMVQNGQGIAVQGEQVLITRNRFQGASIHLRVGCAGIRVLENEIIEATGLAGILLGIRAQNDERRTLSEIDLIANQIRRGRANGIASVTFNPEGRSDVPILGLRILGNEIVDCVGRTVVRGPNDPPFGGIVLGAAQHLVIRENRIEDNGIIADVAVCGIYVRHSRGVEVTSNRVLNNGRPLDRTRIEGPQGGIVLLDASVTVEAVPGAGEGGAFVTQPDGFPAAMIMGNIVVAPRGLALHLIGMGPMMVQGNRLTSRDIVGSPPNAAPVRLEDFIGAVLIFNSGMPAYYFAPLATVGYASLRRNLKLAGVADVRWVVGGKVQFVNNQVTLDVPRGERGLIAAAVLIGSMDDVDASGNQTECILPTDVLLFDLLVGAITAREIGNGLTETPNRCIYSMVSFGVMNTGADNQGTHCIRVEGSRKVDRDNLVLLPNPVFCPDQR